MGCSKKNRSNMRCSLVDALAEEFLYVVIVLISIIGLGGLAYLILRLFVRN